MKCHTVIAKCFTEIKEISHNCHFERKSGDLEDGSLLELSCP